MSIRNRSYTIRLIPEDANPHPVDDNVDVAVVFETGEHYMATFFTVENLRSLLRKNRNTGECRNGLYTWAVNMIVIERLTREGIAEVVADLMESGAFTTAFSGPHTADLDL
jgi:hypothetical protein